MAFPEQEPRPRTLPSRPPFDTRPQMIPPPQISLLRVWVARILVLTGALAIIGGVAIIFWPAAVILAGAGAVAIGIFGMNVLEPEQPQEPGA